jgi:hypothetical protein
MQWQWQLQQWQLQQWRWQWRWRHAPKEPATPSAQIGHVFCVFFSRDFGADFFFFFFFFFFAEGFLVIFSEANPIVHRAKSLRIVGTVTINQSTFFFFFSSEILEMNFDIRHIGEAALAVTQFLPTEGDVVVFNQPGYKGKYVPHYQRMIGMYHTLYTWEICHRV